MNLLPRFLIHLAIYLGFAPSNPTKLHGNTQNRNWTEHLTLGGSGGSAIRVFHSFFPLSAGGNRFS